MFMSRTWNAGSKMLLLGLALAAAIAVAFASMAPRGAAAADTGRVRVMHASPDAPAVDIFVDGAKAVTALAFPSNTPYVELPAGGHNVQVFVSPSDGSGSPVLQATLNVEAGKDYTVLALGTLAAGNLGLEVFTDNNSAPAAGNAHVRLIHASPDAPPVKVAVAGTDTYIFTGVAFRAFGPYVPVPAGTYDLDVQLNSTGDSVLAINDLSLSAGTVYTAVAVGLAGNGSLQVIPLVDAAPGTGSTTRPPAPAAPNTGDTLVSGESASWAPVAIVLGATLLAAAGGLTLVSRRTN